MPYNSLLPNDLDSYWLPFTDNRWFKKNPRMLIEAKGMYYKNINHDLILDGVAGLWAVNAGHCRKKIVSAVQKQVAQMDYALAFQMSHPKAFELANKLTALMPGDLNHVFYTNSGSESVDTALKIALAFHQSKGNNNRNIFIGRERGYHGSGFGGTSVGGITNNRKQFSSLLKNITHLPHTHLPEKNSFSKGQPKFGSEKAEELDHLVELHGASNIAAVIVEPVAGSTGVLVPPIGYLEKLRKICDKNNILLIFDEVITGFGRLGYSFASERFQVIPDMITMAKGLTNATVPMGAVGVKSDIYKTIYDNNPENIELFHGYTYSGHPLACAAAIATLEVYEEESLFEKAKSMEIFFQEAAHSLAHLDVVIDIRNIGMVAGIELRERDYNSMTMARDVFEECFKNGLLVRYTGNTIAISPPLIATELEIEKVFSILTKSIKNICK